MPFQKDWCETSGGRLPARSAPGPCPQKDAKELGESYYLSVAFGWGEYKKSWVPKVETGGSHRKIPLQLVLTWPYDECIRNIVLADEFLRTYPKFA